MICACAVGQAEIGTQDSLIMRGVLVWPALLNAGDRSRAWQRRKRNRSHGKAELPGIACPIFSRRIHRVVTKDDPAEIGGRLSHRTRYREPQIDGPVLAFLMIAPDLHVIDRDVLTTIEFIALRDLIALNDLAGFRVDKLLLEPVCRSRRLAG